MTQLSNSSISRDKLIALILLSALSIILFGVVDRYQVSGGELLVNKDFSNGFYSWDIRGRGKVLNLNDHIGVYIETQRGSGITSIRQEFTGVIDKGQPVQLSADVKVQGVALGEKAWEAARIIFVGVDADGKPLFNTPHILVAKNGTEDWKGYTKVFTANSGAENYYVEIQLVNVSGMVWVKDLSLIPVGNTSAYKISWVFLLASWLFTSLWVFAPHIRKIFSSRWSALAFTLMLTALVGALLSSDLKNIAAVSIRQYIPWIDDDKELFWVGHFFVYCMLSAVVLWKVRPGRTEAIRLVFLLFLALATEIMQFMVDGRTPRVSDFIINISGVAMGALVSRVFSSRKLVNKKVDQCV